MTRTLAKVFIGPPSPALLLAVAGLLLLATLVGGCLVHVQTQQVIADSHSLTHSQDAILLVSRASQSLERLEYYIRMDQAVRDTKNLDEERRNLASLQAMMARLESVSPWDNKTLSLFEDLDGSITGINQQLNQSLVPNEALRAKLVSYTQTLQQVGEQERRVTDERSQRARHVAGLLIRHELVALCLMFSLGVWLFALLLCNWLAHKEAEGLRSSNLALLRRQAKELKTHQASIDEQLLTAVLQTISETAANELVAYHRIEDDDPPSTKSLPPPTIAGEPPKTQKILVVDDDPLVCAALSVRLKFFGYAVVTASDIALALSVASVEMPDLIVLDLCLPDGDGFHLIDRIRVMPGLSQIPIVMLTGSDLDASRQNILKTLSVSLFQKGQPNRDFLKTIQQSLKESTFLPSAFLSA